MPKQGPVTAKWEKPSKGFIKIPKALLESDLSWTAQMIYIRIALLCDNKQPIFKKLEKLAALADVSPSTFRSNYQSLEVAGFLGIDDSGTAYVLRSVPEEMEEIEIGFSDEGEEYTQELDEDNKEEEEVANPNYQEITSRPKEDPEMTAPEREQLVLDAWAKWKQKDWADCKSVDGRVMKAVCITLKHLELKRDDYDILFRNVLLAVSQDDFWTKTYKRKLSMYAIFNLEGDNKDTKLISIQGHFENGQKIYDSKPKGYFFDWSNDEAILKLYNDSREQYKGTPFDIEWNSVYRYECSQRCADHYHKAVLEPLVANYLELDLTEDERRKYRVMEGDVLCEARIRMRSELPDEIDSPAYTPGTVLICSHPETKEVLAWTLMSVPIPVSHDGDYMSRYTKELPLVIE